MLERLRCFSSAFDCVTVPDFFAARFNDLTGRLRGLLVVIILLFMISYVSAQFVGGGKAFAASFHLNPTLGVILTAAIVLFYTVIGGFLAVSLTDVLQAFFMIFALVVLPIVAVINRGGIGSIVSELTNINPSLIDAFSLSCGALIGFVGIGFGSPGNPHIIARYMSIKDPEQLRYSAVVGTIWNVLMAWGALFIGLVGSVYFPNVSMLPNCDTENLYPLLAQQHLHPFLFGIVIASIFAAIMSTADSQLLVAASGVVRDLYEKVLSRKTIVYQRKLVLLSRWVVIAKKLVFCLVLFAWAGLGASLGPTSILSLFWKRTTKQRIYAGLITSTLVTIVWYYIPLLKSFIYELVPGFLLGFAATVIVSLLTRPPENVTDMFDKMK